MNASNTSLSLSLVVVHLTDSIHHILPFRSQQTTEFIIVTIPTIMAAAESCRLASTLREEGVPLKTIVINQVLQQSSTDKFLAAKRADQQRAIKHLDEDKGLKELQHVIGPLFDLEVRGVPALQYFGSVVWKASKSD